MIPPLMAGQFLTFAQLMERLPQTVSREAIRKLFRSGSLRKRRIGKVVFISVDELMEAAVVDGAKATSGARNEE